jgi:tetratricopeptide (TPR) repeat protein
MSKDPLHAQLVLAEKYFLEKNLSQAEVILRSILLSSPDHSRTNELLAYALDACGDSDSAYGYLIKACSSSDASFQALYTLGGYFLARQRYFEAAGYITRSLMSRGEFFEGLHDLGLAYAGLKRYREAVNYFQKALRLNPKSFEALNNLGAALRNLGEFSESLQSLDKALQVQPKDASALLNKGVTFDTMGEFQKALFCYDEALQSSPLYLEAICNKANTLQCMRRYSEADELYELALRIAPQDADSQWNHSHLCLLRGNFELGWDKYEARWSSTDAPPYAFHGIPSLSSSENLQGKKVLVWCEQGLGDTIQFCRYIPLLRDLGAKVTLLVQPALAELLRNLDGVENLETEHAKCQAGFDFQIPVMSLPRLFKTNLSNIPLGIPYIHPDPHKVKKWSEFLGSRDRLRVGLVWSGGFRKDSPAILAVNRRRNIPFSEIAALQKVAGVDFFSLQKGDPAESEFLLEGALIWLEKNLSNPVSELHHFSDTAALIENLDLVISVDTSTAHLAAAMGKPVWMLNRYDSCWRWLLDRSDSPWYPSLRIYSQESPGDWGAVVAKVAADLKDLAKKH